MATRDETIKLSLIDGVTKSLTAIQKGVGGVGAELAKLNQIAELTSKGFSLIGDAVSGLSGSVLAVAEIESALARVNDITQATAGEQVALQQAVQSAVATVGVSADQAASALVLMAEDGFSASEAVGALNTVLAFAKANAQDAATATQALGGVLDTFGEKPAIISSLADQLTAAARAAGVGTNVLQNGLAAIGVQAEQAGLGVSQATAALAALASRGIEGTQAAKQLGTVLTELNNPASRAGKALEEAGLAGKSFTEIVEVLSKDSAKAAPILEALGNRPRAALKVLLADGGGALREFTGIVNEAAGATQEAASVIDETFLGALARFQASIGNLRNEFLKPILQPLADEFTALSEKINSLAASPEFARLRAQFEEFATGAIRAIGNLVENIDFEELTGDIAQFGADSKAVFDDVILVAQSTAEAIRGISFAVKFLRGDAGLFSEAMDSAKDGADKLGAASAAAGRAVAGLSPSLDKGSKSTRGFASDALDAVGKLRAFAASIIDAGRESAIAAAEIAVISDPAAKAREELIRLSGGADQAAIGLERLRLATLSSAIATLARDGLAATDTFRALVAEVGKVEQNIAQMQAAIDKAAAAQENITGKTDAATQSLRNFAGAARDAGSAAESTASANSQVSESFGNIGKTSRAAKADMGNMSQALIELGISLQSTARSGREIIEIWKGITDQYNQSNERIEYAIELRTRQLGLIDEEEQVRRRLQQQYGTDSTLLEELVQLELKRLAIKKEQVAASERELEVEKERIGLAGGLGPSRSPTDVAPSATGARGGAGEGIRAPSITVNVQGMTTDQAREFVQRAVVPELERIQRLSR